MEAPPVAVGTVAGGACAEGPGAERCRRARALGRRRGRGTVRQVRGHEFAPTLLPEAVPALEPRPRRAGLRTLVMIPARIPGVSPRLWLGSPAMDTDRPPGLRPQEPNAARELGRRTVRASPIESLGLRVPAWVGGGGGAVCARRSCRLAAIRRIAPGTARPGAWQEVVHSRWGAYCMPRLLPLC